MKKNSLAFISLLFTLTFCFLVSGETKANCIFCPNGKNCGVVTGISCKDIIEVHVDPSDECRDCAGIIEKIESLSSTVAYVVIGQTKYPLFSDDTQAKIDNAIRVNKGKIQRGTLAALLGTIGARQGIISKTRLENLAKEYHTKVTYLKAPTR